MLWRHYLPVSESLPPPARSGPSSWNIFQRGNEDREINNQWETLSSIHILIQLQDRAQTLNLLSLLELAALPLGITFPWNLFKDITDNPGLNDVPPLAFSYESCLTNSAKISATQKISPSEQLSLQIMEGFLP